MHCPQTRSRCVWGDTGCMCVFPDLNPSVTETTVHPLLSSDSSKATRRLVLIRSPSPLPSLHPHPTTHAPFFFFFFFSGQLGEQLQVHQGIKHPTPSSPPANLSRTLLYAQVISNTASPPVECNTARLTAFWLLVKDPVHCGIACSQLQSTISWLRMGKT